MAGELWVLNRENQGNKSADTLCISEIKSLCKVQADTIIKGA